MQSAVHGLDILPSSLGELVGNQAAITCYWRWYRLRKAGEYTYSGLGTLHKPSQCVPPSLRLLAPHDRSIAQELCACLMRLRFEHMELITLHSEFGYPHLTMQSIPLSGERGPLSGEDRHIRLEEEEEEEDATTLHKG